MPMIVCISSCTEFRKSEYRQSNLELDLSTQQKNLDGMYISEVTDEVEKEKHGRYNFGTFILIDPSEETPTNVHWELSLAGDVFGNPLEFTPKEFRELCGISNAWEKYHLVRYALKHCKENNRKSEYYLAFIDRKTIVVYCFKPRQWCRTRIMLGGIQVTSKYGAFNETKQEDKNLSVSLVLPKSYLNQLENLQEMFKSYYNENVLTSPIRSTQIHNETQISADLRTLNPMAINIKHY